MIGKAIRHRLFSLIAAAAILLSVTATAGAVPTSVEDAKDEIATVEITQHYSTDHYARTQTNTRTHNYETDGDQVYIDYSATLKMTEEMATYLQARQAQLLNAKFNVHVMIDAKDDRDMLEFTGTGDTVTVTFSSSFLKPWNVDDRYAVAYPEAFAKYNEGKYSSKLLKVENGLFYYSISVNKAWAQAHLDADGCIDVPMELISYYDKENKIAYGYEEIPESAASEKPMFYDFTVADWMKEIKVELAQLKVKDRVAGTVSYDSSTWRKVTASGTVDGEFTYERWTKISTLGDYKSVTADSVNTLEFGNEGTIEEWTSNEVWVYLIRFFTPVENPDSPFLNTEDHFAYIIGRDDGLVHPEATITRAEVATIFFRMLTDEVRNQYWSKVNPYGDVKVTDWYNNAISTLTNLGVVNGMPDGNFHPQADITRAEFATMAVRFFLITEDMSAQADSDAFDDIAGHWANKYINMAYLLDIIHGYPDGTYRPNNAIDRAEAMTIVNNTLRRSPCNEGIAPMEEHEGFITWPDNMDKNKWYYAAVQEATNSHDYTYFTNRADLLAKELWQDILPVRDWAAFERAWSDANSAANPGEVVNGHH